MTKDGDATVRAAAARVAAKHAAVHLLVNSAGYTKAIPAGDLEALSDDILDEMLQVNFRGVVATIRAFLPLLKERPDAHLVNIASIFSILTAAGQSAYCSSKFAVRGFSNVLRQELEGSTVGVSVVCPGGVATRIAVDARIGHGVSATDHATDVKRSAKLLSLPPERAAETILSGVERRKPRILVGNDAKVGAFLERLMPNGYYRLMRGLLGD